MKFYYQRLKDLKEDSDLKQRDVAKIIGVAENHYGKYERGEVDIPFSKAIALAKYYNVSLDYLAGLTNDKGGLHCNVLDQEEKKLLNDWKSLNSSDKKLIFYTIETLIEKSRKREEKKSFG